MCDYTLYYDDYYHLGKKRESNEIVLSFVFFVVVRDVGILYSSSVLWSGQRYLVRLESGTIDNYDIETEQL